MKVYKLVFAFVFIAVLIAILTVFSPRANTNPDLVSFISWVKDNAHPIATSEPGGGYDDLAFLKDVVGDARVVCLGETRHDIHEQFRFKHRVVEFLVEEMGFSVFAMEDGLPFGNNINNYILTGEGDPELLLNRMTNWFIWDTEEVLDLILWLRRYNQDPEHLNKVRFYGLDITDPLPGIRNILAYFDRVDEVYADLLRQRPVEMEHFEATIWSEILDRYQTLSPQQIQSLGTLFIEIHSRLDTHRREYAGKTSASEFDWVFRQSLSVKRAHELFAAGVGGDFEAMGVIRETAMADNLQWLLSQNDGNDRIVVWSHNFHIARSSLDLNIPNRPPMENSIPMAQYISEKIGAHLVSIGFSFYQADFADLTIPLPRPEMVDAALARVGLPLFLIDMRHEGKPKLVDRWLRRKQRMRGQGGSAMLVPATAFDALVFFDQVTQTKTSERARQRFSTLR